MIRRIIVTADDLGLAPDVNAAIGRAHRDGILTAASLMVGERAAAEGVAIARRGPRSVRCWQGPASAWCWRHWRMSRPWC
ncbi:MAG: ChbG/HpnK family deacetylase [Acetobacteraceae bacterium]|nr:ChbG/HpnK family deacetylase [Acetobacteraceae bacterium]